MLGFLRGEGGEIRIGYQCAARLGKWSATRTQSRDYRIEAEAIDANEFWLKRRPLELRLAVGANKKIWSWADVEIIEVGPPIQIIARGKAMK